MGQFCSRAEITAALSAAKRLLLTTHNDPDGDGIGSELALARGLKSLNKEVRIVNVGHLQSPYEWMLSGDEAEFYPRAGPFPDAIDADLIVALDFNGWSRLLGFEETVINSGIQTVVIDHHPCTEASADLTYLDLDASATGVMVCEILADLGVIFDLSIALPAYVSLITDTGHFRYSNTKVRAHELAGKFIEMGVKPSEVYRNIFEASSLSRLRLMGEALKNLDTRRKGKIVWASVSREQMKKFGSSAEETEGFLDVIRTLNTMEVGVLFRETEDGQIKISFRSRGHFKVNEFAEKFGGGGHPRAAGVTLNKPLLKAVEEVIEALELDF